MLCTCNLSSLKVEEVFQLKYSSLPPKVLLGKYTQDKKGKETRDLLKVDGDMWVAPINLLQLSHRGGGVTHYTIS